MGLLEFFFKRSQICLTGEDREILKLIKQKKFSSLGVETELIEEIFYNALEAGIIKIIASDEGEVKISISNMEIETFPIKIEKEKLQDFFFISDD